MTVIFDETHRWPANAVIGFDRATGPDRAVHVRFTRSQKAWRMTFTEDGRLLHFWTPAKQRRDTKRFLRDEIARRRLERRSR